jgi:hypothetical protein
MKQFLDDELIDVSTQPRHAASQQPLQPQQPHPPEELTSGPASSPQPQRLNDDVSASPQAQPSQQAPAAEAVGEEVGWGDETTMRTGDGLERIRPEKGSGKSVRFALLPFLNPRRARIHWVPLATGKSPRLCLAQGDTPGWCCGKLREEGRYRVVVLALWYTNANPKTGGYTKLPDRSRPAIEWKIGYLELSPSNYRSISELPEDETSPYEYDYSMSLVNNRYEISIRTKALWKADSEVCKAVEEASRRYVADGGAKLGRKLGKKMTLIEWKSLLQPSALPDSVTLDNIEEI